MGWFDMVPAYRLACLRVCLAVVTIVFHVPKFNAFIGAYSSSTFHVAPAFSWIPPLTRPSALVLIVLHHVTAWSLLLGWAPRPCAWFLAAAGFYVMSLDPEYYAHNAQFHLTLLALVGCAADGVPARRLLTDETSEVRCPAWPEYLVRMQLAIVFFYAAVDKILSPYWGVSGAVLAEQRVAPHGFGLGWIQWVNELALRAIPGALSVATISTEFFLAAALVIPPLWPMGMLVAFGFAVYLEFMVRPGAFAWDVLAALLVYAPAGDRAWAAAYDRACRYCRWNRTLISRLDWLRRMHWIPVDEAAAIEWSAAPARYRRQGGLCIVSPRGRTFRGFEALRMLPILLPGALFVAMAVARFGGGFLANRGYGRWDDLPFLMLAIFLVLWVPGVSRYVGEPIYAGVAAIWSRCAVGDKVVGAPDAACRLHSRRASMLDPSAPAG